MNYKYLIALFAGEEVDAWEPSGSEWIVAKQKGVGTWTPEFMTLMNIRARDSFRPENLMHTDNLRFNFRNWDVNDPDSWSDKEIDYNDKLKFMIINTMQDKVLSQKVLDYFSEMSELTDKKKRELDEKTFKEIL